MELTVNKTKRNEKITKEEAIEIIERYKIVDQGSLYDIDTNKDCDMAIEALKEIDSLKTENELIKRNNEELEKQRTEFAIKIEELTRENKRLKEKFENFGKELFYD